MKIYEQTIEFCSECPNCYIVGENSRCAAAGQKTNGFGEPPDWCPLPDAEEVV